MKIKVFFFNIVKFFRSLRLHVHLLLFIIIGRVKLKNTNGFAKKCAILYKVPLSPKYHSNDTEIEIIIKVFHDMGYCVDIYDYKSRAFFPFRQYDCIFGFGDLFDQICCRAQRPKMLHYLTGRPQWLSDAAECLEIKRLSNIVNTAPERYMNRSAAASFFLSDHLAYVGRGNNLKEVYQIRSDVFGIRLAAQPPLPRVINLDRNRNKVLFFGSVGAAHKGLFRFIEIASIWDKTYPNIKLEWGVIGDFNVIEINALKEYSIKMNQSVEYYGNLTIPESNLYYSQSAYMINPSTSEGCCTSLIESIRCGIIPLFSPHSGINSVGLDFLEIISNEPIDYVKELIKLVEMDESGHMNLVKNCMAACDDHSIQKFTRDIEDFLISALS